MSLSNHVYVFAKIINANNFYINYLIIWILMQEEAENKREDLSQVQYSTEFQKEKGKEWVIKYHKGSSLH